MATLSIPNSFNNGETIDAPQMNANFTAVKSFVELLSAGSNFDTGAINTEDIADNAVTSAKIASASVTTAKIAASVTLTTPNIGVAIGTSLYVTNAVVDHPATNVRTTNYTLVNTDDGIIIETNSVSNIVITVPADSSVNFPIGTRITILRANTGAASVTGAVGVTVNATPGLNLRAQWSAATLLKRAANTWVLMGDLSA